MNAATRQRLHLSGSILVFLAIACLFVPVPIVQELAGKFLRCLFAVVFIVGFCLWVAQEREARRDG